MPKRKRKKRRQVKRPAQTAAPLDQRLELYQKSVQAPEVDVELFTRWFKRKRGRKPLVLREDFCGSALLARTWVASESRRRAIGVDFHFPTLAWGHRRATEDLDRKQQKRLALACANVLDISGPPVDIACALNFSFCALKTRKLLRQYFHNVWHSLVDDGMFFCELYGGSEAIIDIEEERPVEDFTFIWQQKWFNPISRETLCHIHFELADGTRLERAFTYDWRLWTIPEVRELLAEAGFARTRVYWEQVDEDGDGTGEYRPTEREDNQEGWLVYIVAIK